MRNNLGAKSLLFDPTGGEDLVASYSLVNWFQKSLLPCVTFPGIVIQEVWAGHAGYLTCPGVPWVLSNGLATTDNHLLPVNIRKHDVLGNTLPRPRRSSKTWNPREEKFKNREPQRPTNSTLLFTPWFFSLPVCVLTVLYRWEVLLKDKFIQRPP